MRFFVRTILFLCLVNIVFISADSPQGGLRAKVTRAFAYIEKNLARFIHKHLTIQQEAELREKIRTAVLYSTGIMCWSEMGGWRNEIRKLLGVIGGCCATTGLALELVKDYQRRDLTLPSHLCSLKNFEVCHLRSSQQIGGSCGWYQLMNARAIQELVEKRRPLTAYNIKQQVKHVLLPLINKNKEMLAQRLELPALPAELNHEIEERLATYLNLEHYHQIAFSHVVDGWAFYYSRKQDADIENVLEKVAGARREILNIGGLLVRLMRRDAVVQHFLLSTPSFQGIKVNHAVLLSIIKRENEKPLLIYMDSNNRPIESADFYYLAPYFVDDFIQLLDLVVEKAS